MLNPMKLQFELDTRDMYSFQREVWIAKTPVALYAYCETLAGNWCCNVFPLSQLDYHRAPFVDVFTGSAGESKEDVVRQLQRHFDELIVSCLE